MGVKEYFKGIFSVSDEAFDNEEELEETELDQSEDSAPVTRREPPLRRYGFERKGRTAAEDNATGGMRVVLVKPELFNDVADIADHLKQGKTVILNLESTNRDVARRIVDFMSGAAYALSCKLKKVANNTFIIVPENTDISGELLLDDFAEDSYFM